MRLQIISAALFLFIACNSEIKDKPAAEVSDAAPAASTAAPAGAVTSTPVIKEKSSIGFNGAKVTGSHDGVFQTFDGRIDYAGGQPTGINFEIDLATVKTDQERLDNHLKSADFFDVQKYPKAVFTSTSITPAAAGAKDGATHEISGTLDMHGEEKSVKFPAKVDVSPEGVHATSEFTINRQDWGIAYKGAPDNLIRDEVLIRLNLWFPPPPAS
jgi:polyisoprenoid-binding protein YceI